jgi:hypothetical protein
VRRPRQGIWPADHDRLQLSTWQEVQAYLQHKKHIIISIGSTEQHGPTGFIGTDALCPQAVAKEVGARNESMVAPSIAFGMAQHHLDFRKARDQRVSLQPVAPTYRVMTSAPACFLAMKAAWASWMSSSANVPPTSGATLPAPWQSSSSLAVAEVGVVEGPTE